MKYVDGGDRRGRAASRRSRALRPPTRAPDLGAAAADERRDEPESAARRCSTRPGARPTLYVADTGLPLIHVIDLSDPAAPVELAPLFATSIADPTRNVSIGQIAVSPPTREFKRFLYAVDQTEGSILVYDVTDPINGPHLPLTRPHPEIDPFQPPDRILFGVPVASVAFVQHDWPLTEKYLAFNAAPDRAHGRGDGAPLQPEPERRQHRRAAGAGAVQGRRRVLPERPGDLVPGGQVGPYRLRGVFAFATLSNGAVIAIDVDDWDAPCRRPDPLAPRGVFGTSLSGVRRYARGRSLKGPSARSHRRSNRSAASTRIRTDVPVAWSNSYTDSPVTLEWFFPVARRTARGATSG